MITLSLLHPIKQSPVQVWTFQNESVIRIGRSTDNHVILYSAVVSRHHVELRRVGSDWEIVNLGTNGTYLDGKRITQVALTDGAVIRLARSGPNIKIRLGAEPAIDLADAATGDRPTSQRVDPSNYSTEINEKSIGTPAVSGAFAGEEGAQPQAKGIIPVPPHLRIAALNALDSADHALFGETSQDVPSQGSGSHRGDRCQHPRGGDLFCVDCGQPLNPLQVVGEYQLLRCLGEGEIGATYQAWRAGETVAIKTLNAAWANVSEAHAALECEAEMLRQLNHPQIPKLLDFFFANGQPYVVMELARGQDLASYIRALGTITLDRAIAWACEICQLLGFIHSFTPPVLHRDVQPKNLIYQPDAPPGESFSLVDFGAVKPVILERAAPTTLTGYEAPERLSLDATPAADLYAIAPILTYLLTGQNPVYFYAEESGQRRFRATSVFGLPPQLVTILETLTDPHPEARYQSAQEVITALHQFSLV